MIGGSIEPLRGLTIPSNIREDSNYKAAAPLSRYLSLIIEIVSIKRQSRLVGTFSIRGRRYVIAA